MGLRSIVAKLLHKSESKKNDNWVETAAVREIKPFTLGRMRRNFKATVADEVSMKKGSEVKALYREDEWLYVHGNDGKRGFVPQTYCTLTMDHRQGNGQRPSRTPSKILRRISLKETERRTANTMNQCLLEDLNKSSLQRFLDSLPVTKEAGLTQSSSSSHQCHHV
ncbi:unnamed protein product [Nippostrongylus brasiliensis]|uniref:SH3 domain-containing protein n=1 Tax=Nippostrongylus brasiliensis TaxID=27835 RepID=A0A0N4XLW9_NIPBR|nr:unnamed protein product [Nippostrongylus brasiliensis]